MGNCDMKELSPNSSKSVFDTREMSLMPEPEVALGE